MEEEETNLVPRLQQDAYMHYSAAAQPGPRTNDLAQGLLAADISYGYVADSFGDHNALRYDANALLSAHPQTFSTDAFDFTGTTYAEGGYGGVAAALQYYSGPSNYNEYPFASDTASIGTNTFATRCTTYTNGQAIANNPVPTPVSNNPILPLDIGLMTEDPFALSPNIYTTGQASDNYSFPMHGFNNPNAPMDIGSMTGSPFALPPNMNTTGGALTSNPLPMPSPNGALIPVDIGPPISQRVQCKKCSQTCKRQSDLERHAKKHSPGPKEFKCHAQGCKYESHRKDKLVEHMRRGHAAGAGGRLSAPRKGRGRRK